MAKIDRQEVDVELSSGWILEYCDSKRWRCSIKLVLLIDVI